MSKRITLKAEEAAVILRTNEANVDATTKRLLQKVVDKRPLSEEEIGELEGIVANQQLLQEHKDSALAEGADTPDAKVTRHNFKRAERDLAVQSRRQTILEMRTQHPPVPIRAIAERLGISTDTVCKDIDAIRERHSKILDGTMSVALLGQTCQQYDVLYGKAMALAEKYTGAQAKAAFMRTAISALDAKGRLMADTGVIQRVPERHEVLVADAGSVMDRVAKLAAAQAKRTSDVIDVTPRARPPVAIEDAPGEAEGPQEDGSDPFGA